MDKDAIQRIAATLNLGHLNDIGESVNALIARPNPAYTYDLFIHLEPLVITAVSHRKVPTEKREAVCYALNGLHRRKVLKWILCCDGILNVQVTVLGQIDETEAEQLIRMVMEEMDTYLPTLIA